MENEANPSVIPMPTDDCTAEAQEYKNPSARSLFTNIPSAASKFIAKILKNNQPSFYLEPPPTVPLVALNFKATEEEEISRFTPVQSPQETMIRRRGLQHPIFKLIEEHKLGKSVLNIAVPTVVAVLVSGSSDIGPKTLTVFTYIMVSGVCLGCAGIFNGILLRETFPREANAIELSGTVLALICLNGLVGSFLPTEFIWLPIVCGSWCLFPFIIMIL